jgi:hypothetical protein
MTDDLQTQVEPQEPEVDAPEPISHGPLSGKLVRRRGGVETDIEFPFITPAVVGRFDPTVGPIDIDLGALQPEGSYISRRHARFVEEGGALVLEDLASSNGTFILRQDFEKIDREVVQDGVEISFGNARFTVRVG